MLDLRRAAALATLVLGLAACGGSSATPSHGASPTTGLIPAATATAPPSAAPSPGRSAANRSAATGQTDTEWGRIWDALPAGFPTFPGSTPSEEAATGPASATLVAEGDVAKAVATTIEAKLKAAGYRTDALSGPLEDGTYTLEMTGAASGCRVMVTAQPTGGLTTVRVLYGAACPAP